jgi:diguanylate cyclase (GGDEF)-like protein
MEKDAERRLDGGDRRQRRVIAQGGWWGLGTMGVALPYALLSHGPHRSVLLLAACVGFVMSVMLGVAATAGLVNVALRKPIMLAYSAAHIGVVAVLAVADGGAGSPMALGFFGTFTFVAYTMPPRSLVVYGALNVIAYLSVYAIAGADRPAVVPVQLAGMLATAAACALQHNTLVGQRRRLAQIARTDALTGCLNRRGFRERMEVELAAARADGQGFGVLVIDLDGFKTINDRHGHAAGDALLIAAVDAMRAIAPGRPLGRLGGDEFAIAWGTGAPPDALDIRNRLAPHVAASVGAGCLGPDGDGADAILLAADRRMYVQKQQQGRPARAA